MDENVPVLSKPGRRKRDALFHFHSCGVRVVQLTTTHVCWFSPGSAKPCHPCFKLAVLGTFSEVFFFLHRYRLQWKLAHLSFICYYQDLSLSLFPPLHLLIFIFTFFFFLHVWLFVSGLSLTPWPFYLTDLQYILFFMAG